MMSGGWHGGGMPEQDTDFVEGYGRRMYEFIQSYTYMQH